MADLFTLNIHALPPLLMQHYLSDNEHMYSARLFPPHLHDEIEFYVLLDGDASFMVEHSIYKLSPGDVIVTKPNEMHNCVLNSQSVHKHLCFWFTMPNDFLFSSFLNRNFGEGNLISLAHDKKEELISVCLDLHQAAMQQDELNQYALSLRFLCLLRGQQSTDLDVESYIPSTLQTILDDINVNFISIKNLDYFTEKYFISYSTLQRMFKKYLHTTPKLYIETKRLAHSRMLLKQGVSVLDACMQSGFSDYSNYIRLFRNRFGITPKRYQDNK